MRDMRCDIPEDVDQSEYDGFCLDVFSEKDIIVEMTKCYPGIEAEADGFVPVACSARNFDGLYFININDGESGPLYRIFCDGFPGKGFYKKEDINLVLDNYEKLLKYKIT